MTRLTSHPAVVFIATTISICPISSIPKSQDLPQDRPAIGQTLSSVFRDAVAKVRRESRVPLEFPTTAPDFKEEPTLYAVIRTVSPSRYEIEVEYQKNCDGAYACTWGRFRGSAAPIKVDIENPPMKVSLTKGIQGEFISYTCGANCGEPVLTWKDRGFYYTVEMKASDQAELTTIANSAIKNRN